MLIKDLRHCQQFIAGDHTVLRELLHPDKEDLSLRYSLAHAIVRPGQSSRPHSLRSSEVYYILEGEGLMHIGEEAAPVRPGQAVYIPPNAVQWIENTGEGDLVFLCIVDPAWRPEDEQVL
jgi:mannose-6-phosphate isomerase-like protein (cupin superfamily)